MSAEMSQRLYEIARLHKVLSNENRLSIVQHLSGGELGISELAAKSAMPPSILFQHLRVLTKSGLVVNQKQGRQSCYFISKQSSEHALSLLRQLFGANRE